MVFETSLYEVSFSNSSFINGMKSVFNATSSPSTISKPNSLNNSLAIYRVASAKLWCSKYPLENNSFKYLAFLEPPN